MSNYLTSPCDAQANELADISDRRAEFSAVYARQTSRILKAGNEKMTAKNRFSPEDWATLVQAPLMAAMAIVAVSPSGPFGVTREMMAAGRVIQETLTGKAGNDLARAIAEEYSGNPAAFPALNVSGMPPKQVHKQAMDCLRRAIDILYRQNDDEQTEGFRPLGFTWRPSPDSISLDAAATRQHRARPGSENTTERRGLGTRVR